MSLQEEIEEIMSKKAVSFYPESQRVAMEVDTAEVIINKVLDALYEEIAPIQARTLGAMEVKDKTLNAIQKLRGE